MILTGFFQTVEFFVIAALAAAAIVAYMCMPRTRGEAVTHTVGGELLEDGEATEPADGEESSGLLTAEVRDDGAVVLTRSGIRGITASGAVSLAVTVIGFDVHIEERRMRGFSNDTAVGSARFVLDFLAPEWYHIRYSYSDEGEFCSFQLHVKPGIRMKHRIKR